MLERDFISQLVGDRPSHYILNPYSQATLNDRQSICLDLIDYNYSGDDPYCINVGVLIPPYGTRPEAVLLSWLRFSAKKRIIASNNKSRSFRFKSCCMASRFEYFSSIGTATVQ